MTWSLVAVLLPLPLRLEGDRCWLFRVVLFGEFRRFGVFVLVLVRLVGDLLGVRALVAVFR